MVAEYINDSAHARTRPVSKFVWYRLSDSVIGMRACYTRSGARVRRGGGGGGGGEGGAGERRKGWVNETGHARSNGEQSFGEASSLSPVPRVHVRGLARVSAGDK